jgi:hypothetical protein
MAKKKILMPQLHVKNNFTVEEHDVPEAVFERYTKDYLFSKEGKPKFTVLETAAAFMVRMKSKEADSVEAPATMKDPPSTKGYPRKR